MSNREFKMELYNRLLENPSVKRVSGNNSQLYTRCPFCGDSSRDSLAKHFYIKIDIDNDDIPIMYNCFRASCAQSGIMTSDVLRMLDIYDLEMSSSLSRYNKKASKNISNSKFSSGKLDYSVPPFQSTENNVRKVKYIEDRLGINLSSHDIGKFKIVTSLKEFLLFNKIEYITCKDNIARQIEADYVGFLSVFNNFIVFRDITGNHKERYIKYTIKRDLYNNGTFYSIPTTVDLLSSDKIELHVAEGTFDILSVYFNILNQESKNKVFISITSGNYSSAIGYFIKLGIVGNVDIHIYSDKGVDIRQYRKQVKNKYGVWIDSIYIHYNELEKDCGVPRDKIQLKTFTL